jgi:predicted metalloendopeptidase
MNSISHDREARNTAAFANAYTLSYHFANTFLSQEFKEKYLGITREIKASLRNRIQNVDWMSETTKSTLGSG